MNKPKARKEFEFSFKGHIFKVTDYDYSPGYSGNYNNPPEPPEFVINELELWDENVHLWFPVSNSTLNFLLDVFSEDFEETAFNKLEEIIHSEELEADLRRQEDSYNAAAERLGEKDRYYEP